MPRSQPKIRALATTVLSLLIAVQPSTAVAPPARRNAERGTTVLDRLPSTRKIALAAVAGGPNARRVHLTCTSAPVWTPRRAERPKGPPHVHVGAGLDAWIS